MIILINLNKYYKIKGKSIGASYLSLDKNGVSVLFRSPLIYSVQKCFIFSRSRKPPVIRYSNQRNNRYYNTKNLKKNGKV